MNVEQFFDEKRYSTLQTPPESKYDYLLCKGDSLHVPAGWFYFVISEQGFNFYTSFTAQGTDSQPSKKDLKIEEDLLKYVKEAGKLKVLYSSTKFFADDVLLNRYKDSHRIRFKTLDQFLDDKVENEYIFENDISELKRFSPVPCIKSCAWLNFGNVKRIMRYDHVDNYLYQVEGISRVVLFPNSEREKLATWNHYSDEIINKLHERYFNDCFIGVFRNIMPPQLCQSVKDSLGDSVKVQVPNEMLDECYKKLIAEFEQQVKKNKCLIDYTFTKPTFTACRASELSNLIPSNPILNVIWFITEGDISIRTYCYKMGPGSALLFPNSFLYSWDVSPSSIVIFPTGSADP